MNARGILLVFVTAAAVAACSSPPTTSPEVQQLCAALESGNNNPGGLVGTWPDSGTNPVGALTRARDGIRTECPDQEPAAASLDAILAQVGTGTESDAEAYSQETGPPAASRELEYKVEGEGIDTAAVTWSAGGSNGGDTGAQQQLPWTRTVTVRSGDNLVLAGTSSSGSVGDLRCSITDAATGQVVSEKSATAAGGGSSSYASVACGGS